MAILVGDPIVTDGDILESGLELKEGYVLAQKNNGKLTKCVKGDSEAGEPYAILLDDANTTDTDKNVPILLMGQVDADEIKFDDSWTKAELKSKLRKIGIFLKQTY